MQNGDVVGIWGLGPIGQCAVRWAVLKGASRIIGIDSVPARLAFAQKKSSIEVIDFKEHKDVVKRVYELVPRGLNVAIDCGTFHEPKSFIHKAQKALKLETDVPETINEMLVSVRKMGRCGLIAVYTGFANGVDVGALMGKGIRLIGNGQAPVHKYWEEIMNEYVIPGKFDPTFIVTRHVQPLPCVLRLISVKGVYRRSLWKPRHHDCPARGVRRQPVLRTGPSSGCRVDVILGSSKYYVI